jgi:hypothetical protein
VTSFFFEEKSSGFVRVRASDWPVNFQNKPLKVRGKQLDLENSAADKRRVILSTPSAAVR